VNFAADPAANFERIMRSLNSTNFEQGNVVIFNFGWILILERAITQNNSETIFQFGEISEDVLKDGRKQYENGLGPDQILVNPRPIWGDVPVSLIYAFDTNANDQTKM
jgi:cell surface protein SprA